MQQHVDSGRPIRLLVEGSLTRRAEVLFAQQSASEGDLLFFPVTRKLILR
jgi:hypothetical protein